MRTETSNDLTQAPRRPWNQRFHSLAVWVVAMNSLIVRRCLKGFFCPDKFVPNSFEDAGHHTLLIGGRFRFLCCCAVNHKWSSAI